MLLPQRIKTKSSSLATSAGNARSAPERNTPRPADTAGFIPDSIDRLLLEELQDNARISFTELGRIVHMSTPSVIERVKRLEKEGVILRYRADLDPTKLGLHVRAFVKVTVSGDRLSNFARLARSVPEVLECHRVTGNESFIVQVAVRDMNHLGKVIDALMPYVATNTSMVLNSPVQGGRITFASDSKADPLR